MIKKIINTLGTKKGVIFEQWFENHTLKYFKDLCYKGFYKEHLKADKDLIYNMYVLGIRHNILYSPMQGGKTTCMSLGYNILNNSFWRNKFKITQIIYMIGDNQNELAEQAEDDFGEQCSVPFGTIIRLSGDNAIETDSLLEIIDNLKKRKLLTFVVIKSGDIKKLMNVDGFSLDNTLIMNDESHIATKDKDSLINKLLQKNGLDYSGDNAKLKKHNAYILSVSATPYNEKYALKQNTYEINDENKDIVKGNIYYQPGKAYHGFSDFYNNGLLIGLDDKTIVQDEEKFKSFLKDEKRRFDKLFKEDGIRYSMIVRVNGSKSLLPNSLDKESEKSLIKIAEDIGFDVVVLKSGKSSIKYDKAYKAISFSQREGGRPILVLIKFGLKQGICIPNNIKKYILTLYDYWETSTDGLNKNLRIYINKKHLDGLIDYHIGKKTEFPFVADRKENGVQVPCSLEIWENTIYKAIGKKTAADVKREHIVVHNNSDLKPLIFEGADIDKWLAKHVDFNWGELLDKNGNASSGTLVKVAEAFNKEFLGGRFDEDLRIDTRRYVGNGRAGDSRAKNLGYSTPIVPNGCLIKWQKPKNEGKEGWAFVFDISNSNGKKGIQIRIPYGTIGFVKDEERTVYKSRPHGDGYDKQLVLDPVFV